jgi:hypothetical protein
MTRPIKIFAVLLALLSGASTGVASLAACPHGARVAVFTAHALHDCCRARPAHAGSHGQAAQSQVAMTDDAARVESFNDAGTPCADCCAGNVARRTSTPVVAPAQKSKRAAEVLSRNVAPFAASDASHRLALTPTQHAPPPTSARLHILISVMLI